MGRNKGLFTASFDMGLSQTLTGRGYESLTRFTHWLREIQQLAEREPVNAVRDLIRGIDYESWLYETLAQPESRGNAHEKRQPAVYLDDRDAGRQRNR
ncbi:hypothetical protein LNP74_13760 [Klebsiella pneumoniae subsp. pneumoniae]|nr:hypothetical protein [Klebsiella pneumoniae subsp. pneumoniae]